MIFSCSTIRSLRLGSFIVYLQNKSQAIRKKLMTEAAILEKIETLNQAVARLQQRVELEDLRDLESAIAENAGKPLIPWEQVKAELERE